jgi:hypothetical protein
VHALEQQVFVSHTGQDEGAKTFAASILRPALQRAGLAVFMDIDMESGCEWPRRLVHAAADSQVVVVVMSKSYPERFWCMLELDLALNGRPCGARPFVVPVFYDAADRVNELDVQRNWSDDQLLQRLADDELEPVWAECVDPFRWAGNLTALRRVLQHNRRSSFTSKDADDLLARDVVADVLGHMHLAVDVGEVVGFEEQKNMLLAQTHKRLGLWLYGSGESWGTCLHQLLTVDAPGDWW